MQKGNVNGALKILTNVLPLTDETLQLLKLKHPDAKDTSQQALLQVPIQKMHPIVYDDIDKELRKKAAIGTKGGSAPSGLDADGWRRIIVSSCFAAATSDLRKAILELVKKLCITNISNRNDCASWESLVACRLIPLNKNPGLRPIGVEEVLRRISGKVVMMISKQDVMKAAGSLQVCAIYTVNSSEVSKIKSKIKAEKEERYKNILLNLEESFTRNQKRLNEINREKRVSNRLLVLPMVENGFDLTKRQFWDSIRLRYGWSASGTDTGTASIFRYKGI